MVSDEITVSVILPTYNRSEYLAIAIDSLLAQQRPPEEIIVADDHSTDQTGEILARYGNRIRVIRSEKNEGKPAALNRVMPLALGSHLWIFDDDDVALPDALQTHIDYLLSHPDIDFTYSDKFVYQGGGDIWNRQAWHVDPLSVYPPEEFLISTMESMHTLMQGMLIPARCYRAVGPFNAAIQRCEDHDMLLRLAEQFRAGNVERPTFVYRDHDGARGSVSDHHAGKQRFAVMFRYRQDIFRRVWAGYPLRHYLPGYRRSEEPTGALLARALLQRSSIMFRQGLIDEGYSDLQQAMQQMPEPPPKENWLPMLLSRSIDLDWELHDRWRVLRYIHCALQGRNVRHLWRYVARGLYWNFSSAVRRGEWTQARRSFQMLATYGLLLGRSRISPTSARSA